ncbi:BON domain-containing protein [Lyticum sinuosum]|uniref:BON domain-containing protein n=1 Tax=Lyticum sinuosum TaxID=1332059 RepID=A0AAE4VLB1_9RICK|nr:BON domain-containing protein [Lyticum sinuosum]MDZ5761302.1 BON domain-containing protein [Lyticum sinuosum]
MRIYFCYINITFYILILVCILFPIIFSGCAVIAPFTVAGTGAALSDERSIGMQVDDKVILARIKNAQAESKIPGIWSNIEILVVEGRVLMVGCLEKEDYVDEANRISWSIKGVKEVINEIVIDEISFSQRAQDSFIANQIRAKMLVEKDFLSSNYSVSVFKNTAYLIGLSQNKQESNKAILLTKEINGVNKIVNHIILRDDPRRWYRV